MYRPGVDRILVTKEVKGKLKEIAKEQGVSVIDLVTKIVGGLTPPPPAPPSQSVVEELPLANEAEELLPAEEAEELATVIEDTAAPEEGAALELEEA